MMRQLGLSLIELVIFIVIVSIAVLGVMSVFNVSVRGSADPLIYKQSTAIADAMLNEVLAKDFLVSGYAGDDRAQFDDVSDYHQYGTHPSDAQSSIYGINAIDGSAIAGLEKYTVTINIDTSAALGLPEGDIKKVTVVATGGISTITLIGYRTNYE